MNNSNLDRKDLLTTQGELIDLIDSNKQNAGKKATKEQQRASREQYELWWAELEEVKELLRTL
jgi:hypothetical protein